LDFSKKIIEIFCENQKVSFQWERVNKVATCENCEACLTEKKRREQEIADQEMEDCCTKCIAECCVACCIGCCEGALRND